MKKLIFASMLAAMTLVSCSDTKYDTFDKSAADRLEEYKSEYKDMLIADGGLWAMEYFANESEAGYTFVMKFNNDGSVDIYADHKYAKDMFQKESSHWEMIADNGPVLSFNSYNTLFHVFSDPAGIEEDKGFGSQGTSAPVGVGKGHEGDYEFQIMKIEDDGNSIRLLGKKRLYDIYLRKLPTDTDIEKYLADVKAVPSRFNSRFNDMTLTTEDGDIFRLYNLSTGIPCIYPLYGDKIDQTTSQNGIFTTDGIRFREPFEVTRSDGTTFEIFELRFNPDGTLSGPGVADLRVNSPIENMMRLGLSWKLDPDSLKGHIKDLYDAAVKESMDQEKLKFGDVILSFKDYKGKNSLHLSTSMGKKICYDYADLEYETIGYGNIKPSSDLHFMVFDKNQNSTKYEDLINSYKAFKEYLQGDFVMTALDPMCPNEVRVVDKNDSGSSYLIRLQ